MENKDIETLIYASEQAELLFFLTGVIEFALENEMDIKQSELFVLFRFLKNLSHEVIEKLDKIEY